jgi:lysozyme
MTIFYPDVYDGQAGISFHGAPVAMVKATEGTSYTSFDYHNAIGRAATAGAYFCAYHFLHAGNVAAQAQHAITVVGKVVPLMVDFEPTTASNPVISDCEGFVDEFRKLGGICHLNYFPRWYWQQLGSPDLAGFRSRGLHMVSSDYTTYSDTGPGWTPYGGITPSVWQYTDNQFFNGHYVDFNAYKGTREQFIAMVTGTMAAPRPVEDDVPNGTLTFDSKGMAMVDLGSAGTYRAMGFASDWGVRGQPQPVLRIAVHSFARGWSQIEENRQVPAAGKLVVSFTAHDVDYVSILRQDNGSAAISYGT